MEDEVVDSPSGVKTLKDGMVMWLDIRTDSVGMRSPGHPWPHVTYYFLIQNGLSPWATCISFLLPRCVSYSLFDMVSICLRLSLFSAVFYEKSDVTLMNV